MTGGGFEAQGGRVVFRDVAKHVTTRVVTIAMARHVPCTPLSVVAANGRLAVGSLAADGTPGLVWLEDQGSRGLPAPEPNIWDPLGLPVETVISTDALTSRPPVILRQLGTTRLLAVAGGEVEILVGR